MGDRVDRMIPYATYGDQEHLASLPVERDLGVVDAPENPENDFDVLPIAKDEGSLVRILRVLRTVRNATPHEQEGVTRAVVPVFFSSEQDAVVVFAFVGRQYGYDNREFEAWSFSRLPTKSDETE